MCASVSVSVCERERARAHASAQAKERDTSGIDCYEHNKMLVGTSDGLARKLKLDRKKNKKHEQETYMFPF